jgi:preprotein translocase subunit YajC
MSNQGNLNVEVAKEESVWSRLLDGPLVLLIIGAAVMFYFQYQNNKDEKKKKIEYEEMINTKLNIGAYVQLNDGICGMIEVIDKEKGTFIINSAGTKLERTISSISSFL